MTPEQALAYIHDLGDEVLNMRLSLEAPALVLRAMGDPQKSLPAVLVGGTNGKGSVSQFVAAIGTRAGYRTGLYTSPHLESVHERIRVDGREIGADSFARCLTRVVDAQDRLVDTGRLDRKLTFFETLTLTAFTHFCEEAVALVVLEVGLGGRLDATNLADPLVSVVASIGFDHRDVLGYTIPEIAREKAAIGRPGRELWVGPVAADAEEAIRAAAATSFIRVLTRDDFSAENDGSGCYRVATGAAGDSIKFHLRVFGRHQAVNAVLAVRVAQSLQPFGFLLPPPAVRSALEETEIAGRLERVCTHPTFFLDGGHNPPAIGALAAFIAEQYPQQVFLIFGIMRDKEIEPCARMLAPLCKTVFVTPVRNRRSASAAELQRFFPPDLCVPAADTGDALRRGLAAAGGDGVLFACGSLFLVGEIKFLLRARQREGG